MRPCDGTSGLVRGNRRKAVFAYKGLFCEGHLLRFRFRTAGFIANFESAGKIEACQAHLEFCQQNRRSQESKIEVWSTDLAFSPYFRNHLSIICNRLWNPRARRPFSVKRAAPRLLGRGALALALCSVLIGAARCCGFSMRPACAFSRSDTEAFQVQFMSAPLVKLERNGTSGFASSLML